MPAAPSVAAVPARPEARVANTPIAMGADLLEARQPVPLTTQLDLAAPCHCPHSRTLHIVVIPNARLSCDTLQACVPTCEPAPAHIAVEPACSQAHVTAPCAGTDWLRRLECSMLIPVAVVVENTSTRHDVPTWKRGLCNARAMLVNRTSDALQTPHPTAAGVASHTAWAEAGVAAPVVAMRERLLEGGELVEGAVVVVDATTDHCVAV